MTIKKPHIAIIIVAVLGIWVIVGIHPFLAYHHPIKAEVLVVEGWAPMSYMPLVVEEFRRGNYRHIVTVGAPLPPGVRGYPNSSAERASQALIQLGIDSALVTAVPAPPAARNKTWSYVKAFRDWLVTSGNSIQAINVFTVDVHARKSLLLFQRALGPSIRVGVISARHQCYEASYWWLSRTGIWLTAKNAVGYLDALLFTGNN